jgi:hypothetical protein
MYEVTTIGNVRALGAAGASSFDLEKYKTKEVMTGVAAGLLLGVILGALLAKK